MTIHVESHNSHIYLKSKKLSSEKKTVEVNSLKIGDKFYNKYWQNILLGLS